MQPGYIAPTTHAYTWCCNTRVTNEDADNNRSSHVWAGGVYYWYALVVCGLGPSFYAKIPHCTLHTEVLRLIFELILVISIKIRVFVTEIY